MGAVDRQRIDGEGTCLEAAPKTSAARTERPVGGWR